MTPGRQLTFPSLQDGASFRVPQGTAQRRFQVSDALALVRGRHALRVGTEVSRTTATSCSACSARAAWRWCRTSREFDLNRDGRVDDNDLLFAVTLRSGKPDQDLLLDDCTSTYLAGFVQDDWRVTPQLTLNLGLRYELDTDVKNISGYGDINPIVQPFLRGRPRARPDNFGPARRLRLDEPAGSLQVHGGYGLYYDRVTLEIISLERGLDGRALPIEVRAGNVFFLDPGRARCRPSRPRSRTRSPASSCPGAGASGINIIDNRLENPTVQQFNLGTQAALPARVRRCSVDLVHNLGTHFIIGRTVGEVFNPVVGGPDRVVNLESSVGTATTRCSRPSRSAGAADSSSACRTRCRAPATMRTTTRSRSAAGPIDPNDL